MGTEQSRLIEAREIEAYERDGVVVLRKLVSPKWLERIATAIERDIENPGPFYHGYETPDGSRFHGNMRLFEHDQDMNAFCRESVLPQIAQGFLNSGKVNLLYDQLFVKEAGTLNRTRWHNDQPYWPIRGRDVVSIWVALDTTTSDNGRLEFVSGSHLWDRWFQPEPFGPNKSHQGYDLNPDYEPMLDIESARDGYDIVSWDVEPGDVYVFGGMTVHGAAGNSTPDRRRRGYTVRYCGDDVVYEPRVGISKPILDDSLNPGDPLGGDQFPLIAVR